MKILLLMNQNSYAGREYLAAIKDAGIDIDVASIGDFPEINFAEEERCGGYWKPKSVETFKPYFNFYNFTSLTDEALHQLLVEKNYDFCIQGGTGILKKNIINQFKIGILNFHPGDLPFYRGCSAPEWQLYENNPVISTAHLVDEGIDTGKILKKRILEIDSRSYERFRSSIYPQTAKFVVELVKEIIIFGGLNMVPEMQNEGLANYRKYIGMEKINELKRRFIK